MVCHLSQISEVADVSTYIGIGSSYHRFVGFPQVSVPGWKLTSYQHYIFAN